MKTFKLITANREKILDGTQIELTYKNEKKSITKTITVNNGCIALPKSNDPVILYDDKKLYETRSGYQKIIYMEEI